MTDKVEGEESAEDLTEEYRGLSGREIIEKMRDKRNSCGKEQEEKVKPLDPENSPENPGYTVESEEKTFTDVYLIATIGVLGLLLSAYSWAIIGFAVGMGTERSGELKNND